MELAFNLLVASNVILLLSAAGAFVSRYDWKQIAMRKSNVIENYERDVRELQEKNDRLSNAIEALWRKDFE